MLRRRILASAMASVMALSSVAVVASAGDETAVTNVKSRADLEALVKSYGDIRDKDIYEKGSVSAERFLAALDYAENVIADTKNSTAKDFTAAYLMVESLANMDSYDAAALAQLVKTCQSTYDSQNILNDEIGDAEYKEGTFADFEAAFLEAERLVNSDDVRLTTDAYIELQSKYSSLAKKDSVKKSEFRAVLKAYEANLKLVNEYDTWRRGTLSCGDFYWGAAHVMTYEDLLDAVFGSGVVVSTCGEGWHNHDALKLSEKKDLKGNAITGNALDYVRDLYDEFDKIKSASVTTNDEILAAYNTAKLATSLFDGWKADETTRANKAKVAALLKQYHSQLVAKYNTTEAEALYKVIKPSATTPATATWTDKGNKYYAPALKSPDRVALPVTDGYYDSTSAKTTVVAKNSDILRFVKVDSADVALWGTNAADAKLAEIMEYAELYTACDEAKGDFAKITGNENNDVFGLDTIGQVKTANGSVTEWTLIYRKLNYILTDMFNGSAPGASKTLAELEALITKSYELTDKTGDAAIFNKEHMDVVDSRQDAISYIAEYKKGNTANIDNVYNDLKNKYDALEKILAKYKYSYGEIEETIYEVASDLDAGVFGDNTKLAGMLSTVAKDLSILKAYEEDDNSAFTKDRIFQPINRLKTDTDDRTGEEKALKASYEALLKAVEEAKAAAEVKLGDVNGDGEVNILDAVAIAEAGINGTTIDVKVGDFNQDGTVNVFDAVAIAESRIQ